MKKGTFGTLSPERRREVASMGGKAAYALGVITPYTSETGRAAGKKGGQSLSKSKGRDYFVQLGRKGGLAANRRKAVQREKLLAYLKLGHKTLKELSVFLNTTERRVRELLNEPVDKGWVYDGGVYFYFTQIGETEHEPV